MMDVLKKGSPVSFGKSEAVLQVLVDWNGGAESELSAFLLGDNGKLMHDEDFVFYNNLSARKGAASYNGGKECGAGFEMLSFSLASMPDDVNRIAICVSAYADEVGNAGCNLGKNGRMIFCRSDSTIEKGSEICALDLEEHERQNIVLAGMLYRKDDEWHFRGTDEGFTGGLPEIIRKFGGDV